jgi:hypothetical protein
VELAGLYASAGQPERALEVIRRRSYLPDDRGPVGMSTSLRLEGAYALASGDTAGARRALTRYLELRADPEPRLVPARDSVRALLARLGAAPGGGQR